MSKPKTIEQHYEELRQRAQVARAMADGARTGSDAADGAALTRICVRASELAAEDWPRVRRVLAEAGSPMPEGPRRFGRTGYNIFSTVYGSVCSVRTSACPEEDEYVERACAELAAGEWTRAAEAAEDEWERYRRAVSQGVALPPCCVVVQWTE
jgi:hypothetical protein